MYSFNSIIGNDRVVKSLKTAMLNNRINHAYIFDGAKGTGKKTIANTFAKALNCEEGGSEPCGKCISCLTLESGNNPDVVYVKRNDGDKEIKVDTVRNVINKNVEIKPYRNKYKIFIIEDADTMNAAAQNAFLKTLEEPPTYAVFLLLAENYNKFLVTILSRCQRFKMQPVPAEKIRRYVLDKYPDILDDTSSEVAALYSQGSIGKAVELAASDSFRELRGKVVANTINLLETDLIGMYRIAADMDNYKADIESYLDIMYLLYRDSLVYLSTGSTDKLIQSDRIYDIRKICSLTGKKRLIAGCEYIEQAVNDLKRHGDFQLVTENLFFKLKEK